MAKSAGWSVDRTRKESINGSSAHHKSASIPLLITGERLRNPGAAEKPNLHRAESAADNSSESAQEEAQRLPPFSNVVYRSWNESVTAASIPAGRFWRYAHNCYNIFKTFLLIGTLM